MRNLSFILFFFLVNLAWTQNANLAQNYLDQGEYEKALAVYEQLLEENPRNQKFLLGLVEAHKNLEQLQAAKKALKTYLNRPGNYPNIEVELGYLFDQEQQIDSAKIYYQSALAKVSERPNYAYIVGKAFQNYGLLNYAEETYEIAQSIRPSTNFSIELARIYGEQSKFEKMFNNYVDIIEKNARYFKMLSPRFSDFITKDPNNKANLAFKTVLLQRNQNEPRKLYNEMLSWLFVQQGNLNLAFIQEKAIYARSQTKQLNSIFELGQIAFEQEDYSLAKQIFKEVQAKTNQPVLFYRSAQYLLKLLQFNPENSAEAISQAYQDFFTAEKISALTHAIYLDWAKFIANQLQNPQNAIKLLDEVNSSQIRPSQMASTKLLKGDLLRLEGQFNQALLLYAQVEKLVPNSDEAREAKFKTAQTSYFQGDFDWALTQLDVLKQSVSQRMANDALELALHIRENSYLDSTQTDLKRVAKADLLRSQQRYHKAINILQKVLESYKDVAIVDEALYRLALNFESLSNFEAAAEAYNQLVTDYPESILADNASFALGLIYRDQLNATEKAKSKFEQIIFKHPDSIYFVEAREIFRTLRGDKIE